MKTNGDYMAKMTLPKKDYKPASAYDIRTQTGRAQLWFERIRRARAMLQLDQRRDECKDAIKYLDGSYALTSSGEMVYLNEGLPAVEDIISGTIPRIPTVDVQARQVEQDSLADKCGALIDSTMDSDLSRVYEASIALEWDDFNYGIGIGRLAWHDEEKSYAYRPTTDPQYLAPHVQRAKAENERPFDAEVSAEDDHEVHIQVHEMVLPQLQDGEERASLEAHTRLHWAKTGTKSWAYPVLNRVDPLRFVFDPDAPTWEERRWEAEECDEFVSSLQKIPGIKNLNPINCPALDEFDTRNEADRITEETDWENQRVKVWKIHDRINDQYVMVPSKDSEDMLPLLEEDWPYGAMDIYEKIVHRPRPGKVYGFASIRLIQPILVELAKTNAVIRRHNRRASKYKVLFGAGATKDDAKKLDSDRPIEKLSAAALGTSKEFKPPSLPKEILDYREMLMTELRRIMGSDIMTQGGDTAHRITASEAQLRGGYQQSRLTRRRLIVSRFMTWVARNIVMMYRDFGEGNLTVRVLGPQGAEMQLLDPAAIPDDLAVRLDMESASAEKQNQDILSAQTFAELTAKLAPGMYDPIQLLVMVGERMGIPTPEKFFVQPQVPGGPPMQGGMASQPNLGGSPVGGSLPANNEPTMPNTPDLRIANA